MKAYVVCFIDVEDSDRYKTYAAQVPATIAAFGGRYLARNGAKHALEGPVPEKRVVLLEFPSVQRANEWHDSPAYQEVLAIRTSASKGHLFIVEGCDDPMPGPARA